MRLLDKLLLNLVRLLLTDPIQSIRTFLLINLILLAQTSRYSYIHVRIIQNGLTFIYATSLYSTAHPPFTSRKQVIERLAGVCVLNSFGI